MCMSGVELETMLLWIPSTGLSVVIISSSESELSELSELEFELSELLDSEWTLTAIALIIGLPMWLKRFLTPWARRAVFVL